MDRSQFLHTPISYLKGIGPAKAELLQKELGIFTFRDLLYHFPFRYVDRSKIYNITEINSGLTFIQIKGSLISKSIIGEKRAKRLVATLKDRTGSIELVWFQNIQSIEKQLHIGSSYLIYGRPTEYRGSYNIAHPEIELLEPNTTQQDKGFYPIYPSTEKLKQRYLDSKALSKLMQVLVDQLQPADFAEYFPTDILSTQNLMSLYDAIRYIHFPTYLPQAEKAVYRMKFDELFWIQMQILATQLQRHKTSQGFIFEKIDTHFKEFYEQHLPFELTQAQKNAIKDIRKDVLSGKQMNRLLQGDVGSGKTIVALMACLMAIDNGFQAVVMAPTEILARQHYDSFQSLLKGMPIRVGILTGSLRASDKKIMKQVAADGDFHIFVGTHALIEDNVHFHNLGIAIIDEQHRFGVEQRAKLWNKNKLLPHVLVMTATPIPRTLSMTLWGDLDTTIINELPPGRTPIATYHYLEEKRYALFEFLKKEIAQGRQVYIVYPLIEESEKLDLANLYEGYEAISRDFPPPTYTIGILHGKMKQKDKDIEMARFLANETQILVATTVIEVGVNVPNATVMVIENAERFGLSQLHQLRGRVGRGSDKSYCFLLTKNDLGYDSRKRMKIMTTSTDGFYIAEEDLKIRGPGNIQGKEQSGISFLKIADLKTDAEIVAAARLTAQYILNEDPQLAALKHDGIRKKMLQLKKENPWSKVS